MDARILLPKPQLLRKRWFGSVVPRNMALACFSLALCLHAGAAEATSYNIGEDQSTRRLADLFVTGSSVTFDNNDSITLYNDDSSLSSGFLTGDLSGDGLTIRSDSDAIRTITQNSDSESDQASEGGLFRGNTYESTNPQDYINTTLNLRNLILADSAVEGIGLFSGLGGVVMSEGVLTVKDSENVTFKNNRATGGAANGSSSSTSFSGLGGALFGADVSLNNVNNITFQGNQAIGGESLEGGASTSSGWGGAIAASDTVTITDSGSILFADNRAVGGNSSGTTWTGDPGDNAMSHSSGWGGAIFADVVTISEVGGLIFENNQAVAGTSTGLGSVAFSGLGGAIAAIDLTIVNSSGVVFRGNQAIGGDHKNITSAEEGTYVYYYGLSGLGGAIYLTGAAELENVTFVDNSASTGDGGDYSSGRGGAIFVDAAAQIVGTTQNLTISAVKGGTTFFSGNTHNPGRSGTVANSIYFGNTNVQDVNDPVSLEAMAIEATFHADANSTILMYDPMASQAEDMITRPDAEEEYLHELSNVELTITKTGAGTWALAGHNDMQSATIWTVEQGTLHLGDRAGATAHIDLGHATTALFTVEPNVTLRLDPMWDGHRISAIEIDLQTGSVVRIDDSSELYAPVLNVGTGHREILYLEGDHFANNSTLGNSSSGAFYRNAYDYTYENLGWNSDRTILSGDFTSRLNPDRGAISATTAASAMVVQNPFAATLFTHMDRLFRNVPEYDIRGRRYVDSGSGLKGMFSASRDDGLLMASFTPGAGADDGRRHSVPNNVWVTGSYSYTSQDGHSDYDIKTPAITMGYDRWVERDLFVGAAISYARPEYDSSRADVEANSYFAAIYGGAMVEGGLELSAFVSYGVSDHDQTRRVYDLSYDSEYDAHVWSGGFGLALPVELEQNFVLRPFATYEYIYADIDGYREWSKGLAEDYALDVDCRNESLHRVQAGLGMDWQKEGGFFINGRAYYLGLYGDTTPEAGAYFVDDPGRNGFTSIGDELDEHSLGLGLQLGISITDGMEAAFGYNLLMGEDSTTHQGNVNLLWRF